MRARDGYMPAKQDLPNWDARAEASRPFGPPRAEKLVPASMRHAVSVDAARNTLSSARTRMTHALPSFQPALVILHCGFAGTAPLQKTTAPRVIFLTPGRAQLAFCVASQHLPLAAPNRRTNNTRGYQIRHPTDQRTNLSAIPDVEAQHPHMTFSNSCQGLSCAFVVIAPTAGDSMRCGACTITSTMHDMTRGSASYATAPVSRIRPALHVPPTYCEVVDVVFATTGELVARALFSQSSHGLVPALKA
ncbi:hypothetical protein BST61_g3057 [Cercospora zeina]